MSIKLPDNLPNQAAAIEKAGAYEKNAKEIGELNQFMTTAMNNALKQYKSQHPEIVKKIGYSYQGHSYVRKPGTQIILQTIMRFVAYPGGIAKTKLQILEDVKTQLPQHKDSVNYNAWYRKLKPAQWNKMQEIIQGNMAKPVSIKGCKTLDDIRKKLIAESAKRATSLTAKVTITIDATKVVIGKEVYAISMRKAKGKEYPSIRVGKKRTLINVTALREALQNR